MADKHILLVEGQDDQHTLWHLLNRIVDRSGQPRVKPKEGIEKLLAGLGVEIDAPELERLGVIVDADSDIQARWQAIKTRLEQVGQTKLPDVPEAQGTILSLTRRDEAIITIGVWLMPDNRNPGSLEHFVQFLIPETNNKLWKRAKKCVDGIPQAERLFTELDTQKAYVHTWLAWQKEPGRPIGAAITAKYLNADAPLAQSLIAWLRRLFDLPIGEDEDE